MRVLTRRLLTRKRGAMVTLRMEAWLGDSSDMPMVENCEWYHPVWDARNSCTIPHGFGGLELNLYKTNTRGLLQGCIKWLEGVLNYIWMAKVEWRRGSFQILYSHLKLWGSWRWGSSCIFQLVTLHQAKSNSNYEEEGQEKPFLHPHKLKASMALILQQPFVVYRTVGVTVRECCFWPQSSTANPPLKLRNVTHNNMHIVFLDTAVI